jgi:hypothetical protein
MRWVSLRSTHPTYALNRSATNQKNKFVALHFRSQQLVAGLSAKFGKIAG